MRLNFFFDSSACCRCTRISAKLNEINNEVETMNGIDTTALHAAMRAQVDQQFLPFVSTSILRGQEVMDTFCYGDADKEAGIALREDHIFLIPSW
jgi:hypothetical protein